MLLPMVTQLENVSFVSTEVVCGPGFKGLFTGWFYYLVDKFDYPSMCVNTDSD